MTYNPYTKKAVTGAAKGRKYQMELEAQIDELRERVKRAEAESRRQRDIAAVSLAKIRTEVQELQHNAATAPIVVEAILREILRWEGMEKDSAR